MQLRLFHKLRFYNSIYICCGDTYGTVITWLRTRLSMEITRASLLCLRGSRTPFRHYQTDDVGLENMFSGLV